MKLSSESVFFFLQDVKNLHEYCYEGSTSSIAQQKCAGIEHKSVAEVPVGGKGMKLDHGGSSQNEVIFDSMKRSSNFPENGTLSAFAQVFYREIKRHSKCRRKVTPLFQPVLETLYEQAEIVA